MLVYVATEARFHRDSDGRIRSDGEGRGYGFWSRYVGPFDSVSVIGRVSESVTDQGFLVAGEGVEVLPLLDYSGLKGWLSKWPRNRSRVARAVADGDAAYLARTPGLVASMLASAARSRGLPYALEVVGDPEGVITSGILPSFLGRLIRPITAWHMRRQCSTAIAVSYVTREQLQLRYPAKNAACIASYSSVELPPGAFKVYRRASNRTAPVVVNVSRQSQLYKGQDILIRAVASLNRGGQEINLRLIGDGKFNGHLRRLARTLGIEAKVEFLGHIASAEAIRQELDDADLFVLPSRTEGLPRALLEAMARGLPCLSTPVGGISEILPEEDMFEAGNVAALVSSVAEVLGSEARLALMSRRNFLTAADYASGKLVERRNQFYWSLRKILEREAEGMTPILGSVL